MAKNNPDGRLALRFKGPCQRRSIYEPRLVSSAFCKLGVPGYIASIENHARRQTGRLAIAQRKPCPAALDCEFGNAEPNPASSIAISIVSPSAPHVKWRSQEGFEQQA